MALFDDVRKRREAAVAKICGTCHESGWITEPGVHSARARRCPDCTGQCNECGGDGVIFENDWTGQLVTRPCPCAELDTRIALFNRARVPLRYDGSTLEGYESSTRLQTEAKMRLLRLVGAWKDGARGVGISGPVGTGKTHLLAALVRDLTLHKGVACRFVEFTHLLGEIRAGYDSGRGESRLLEDLVDAPVLIIDELGKGLSTEWQVTILDGLISRRYNRAVSTFFATNFPWDTSTSGSIERRSREHFAQTSLEERVGTRMMSRLGEMCDLLTIDGEDYRRRRTA